MMATELPVSSQYVLTVIIVEIFGNVLNVILCFCCILFKIARKVRRLQISALFVLNGVFGMIYSVCRLLLIGQQLANNRLLQQDTTYMVRSLRMTALTWGVFFLPFVCLSVYIRSCCSLKEYCGQRKRRIMLKVYLFCVGLCLLSGSCFYICIKSYTSGIGFSAPLQFLSLVFTVAGYILIRRALVANYNRVRFASLSLQFEISQNIRLIREFSTIFKVIVVFFVGAEVLLILCKTALVFGTHAHQLIYSIFLLDLTCLFVSQTVSAFVRHVEIRTKVLACFECRAQDCAEPVVTNMFNRNIIVENTAENAFSVIREIWQDPVIAEVASDRPKISMRVMGHLVSIGNRFRGKMV
ncbi:unnamed protein product [Bursaphelenchus xylophilus]|uniref:(pine wood nematode) hypothetical protein n=1 Tax=Bursaphelenchus xylophilus TaxID=6326 RepID=A0A1I7RW53_BURXY|nr:unnamed protein product [Bursaphelenchus xylophilus]CAG9095141.1 unnamed protein product [Bursaphelenchus xylophilus]